MQGYTGYHTNKTTWSPTTIAVVVVLHVLLVAGMYQLSQTEFFQVLITVSKLITVKEPPKPQELPPPQEKEPEPEKRVEPLPELPPEPAPVVKEAPQESVESAPVVEEPVGEEGSAENALLASSRLFTIGKPGSK